MFGIGTQELVLILIIALIIFGPSKLPELGKSLGRGIREFRSASNQVKHEFGEAVLVEEKKDTKDAER